MSTEQKQAGQAAHTPTLVRQAMESEVAPGSTRYRTDVDSRCRIVLIADTNFQTPDETRRVAVMDDYASTGEAAFIVRACNSHAALVDFAEAFFVDGRLLIPKQDQLSNLVRLHAAALQLAKQ